MAKKNADISLEELLDVGAHFGHRTDHWNPKSAPYIFATREGVHIFDLEKTRELLYQAREELKQRAGRGETILFVGTKPQAQEAVRKIAQKFSMPYIDRRWIGGIFTNFEQVKKSIEKLAKMGKARDAGEYQQFTKKERLLIDREITKLERVFGGVAGLSKLPDMLFLVDTVREETAVFEAIKTGVPIMAIVDSNSDPTIIDYPIPANDDSIKSVEYILEKLEEAMEEGQKELKVKSLPAQAGEKLKVEKVAIESVSI